jgi:hypothetical protein
MQPRLRALAHERLAWFLALAGVVFAVGAVSQYSPARASQPPGRARATAREEALYRAALANGLERDDPIIRRHLAQKMDFLFRDPALIRAPGGDELSAYLAQHADRYRTPGRTAFSHVFYSRARRGTRAELDARTALAALRARPDPPERSPDWGDPCMAGYDFALESAAEIEAQFGAGFAAAVAAQAPGVWLGPVESAYGAHIVRVRAREAGHLPTLAEVRTRVFNDWMSEQRQAASDRQYALIRSHYQVVIQQEKQ